MVSIYVQLFMLKRDDLCFVCIYGNQGDVLRFTVVSSALDAQIQI